MAALKHTFVLLTRLFTTSAPRTLVLRSHKSTVHFGFARNIASEAQTTLESGQQEKKSKEVSAQENAARAKVSEFLEKNGISVKRVRKQIDLRKLSVEKISRVFKFLDDVGIDRKQQHKIITGRPTILTTKEDFLRHRVKIMRNVGIYPESVVYVIKESPGVLTARIEESLPDKVRSV